MIKLNKEEYDYLKFIEHEYTNLFDDVEDLINNTDELKYHDMLKLDYDQRQQHFTRPASSLIEQWQKKVEQGPLKDQSVYELMKAMNRVIKRHMILEPYETKVTIKELSVEERVEQIQQRMTTLSDPVSFEILCQDCTNLHMIVVTFLAILDLIHQRWLVYLQKGKNDEIWVMKGNMDE